MDKDKLIQQLKEQNKLLRRECAAAEIADAALNAWLNDTSSSRKWQAYTNRWRKWQAAIEERKATEPPF